MLPGGAGGGDMGRDCLCETQFCPMGIPSLFKAAVGGNDGGEWERVLYFRHGDHQRLL